MRKTITCPQCGKTVKTTNKKFCSSKCYIKFVNSQKFKDTGIFLRLNKQVLKNFDERIKKYGFTDRTAAIGNATQKVYNINISTGQENN